MDLKGTEFYMSEKHPDKLINEGVFTIFNELDEVKRELRAMLKPNGSQQAPARTCYDLFLCNPSFKEGLNVKCPCCCKLFGELATFFHISYYFLSSQVTTGLIPMLAIPLMPFKSTAAGPAVPA